MAHLPALLQETVELLNVTPGGCYVDGTVGGGGHAEAILKKMDDSGVYVAIDRDPEALQKSKERLKGFNQKIYWVKGVFSQIPQILNTLQINRVDGILVDLGVSSFQLDDAHRGFSFLKEGPLDMRMDSTQEGETAAEIVNRYSEKRLEEIFKKFGEERFARRIARAIVASRRAQPFLMTTDLAHLINRVVPPAFRAKRSRVHPATRIFQALRIVVNEEIDHLDRFLSLDFDFLKPKGRIVIISFHSLEDRKVKQAFRAKMGWKILTKRPVRPGGQEVQNNPRSRSAKLRGIEKCQDLSE